MHWQKEGITTFLIDFPILVFLGLIASLYHRSQSFRLDTGFWHGFVLVLLFSAAAFYGYSVAPDWMWMYFAEAPELHLSHQLYIFVFMYVSPYVFGFTWGKVMAPFSTRAVWLCICSMLAIEVWIVTTLFDRYAVIGTRMDYLTGTAVSLFSTESPVRGANGFVLAMAIYALFMMSRYKVAQQRKFGPR